MCPVGWIGVDDATGSIGNVAQVTKQRAFVSDFDVRIRLTVGTNGIQKVGRNDQRHRQRRFPFQPLCSLCRTACSRHRGSQSIPVGAVDADAERFVVRSQRRPA